MYITLTNVKATLTSQNIDPSNSYDMNALTQKILNLFPDNEGWSYDQIQDELYILRPNPTIDASQLGEVSNIDYTIW